jgi:hypothetical protein
MPLGNLPVQKLERLKHSAKEEIRGCLTSMSKTDSLFSSPYGFSQTAISHLQIKSSFEVTWVPSKLLVILLLGLLDEFLFQIRTVSLKWDFI